MPFDRPTKNELLEAVKEFMQDKLLPELEGHLNFNTRVAINVLKTLERELELGESITIQSKERLLGLLNETDTSLGAQELNKILSKKIRNRELDYQDKGLNEHLWKTTMDKLSVDNPRYVSYQQELNK